MKMNWKMLLKLEMVIATSCLTILLPGYGDGTANMAKGESAPYRYRTTARQFPSAKLQYVLDRIVTTQKIPGAVMYISAPSGSWTGASGVSDLESKTPLHPNDGFSIASTSKTFVAVVVLQLVEEGKIDLDGAIASYLPIEVSTHVSLSNKITVRQLLNHTSGVPEYLSTNTFNLATKHRSLTNPWTAKEAIKYIYDLQPQAQPGEKYAYTDSNYILLELIVEQITGKTLATAIRSRILNPLGLKNTYTELREPPIGHVVTGYHQHYGKLSSSAGINDGNGLGDGGLISSGEDLGKFMKALFARKNLLSPAMMQQMYQFISDRDKAEYGLGVERLKTAVGTAVGHSGSAYGFVSVMLYLPGKDITIVVLANRQGADPKAIAVNALEALIGKPKPHF